MALPRWLKWEALGRVQIKYIRHAVVVAVLAVAAAFGGLDDAPVFQTVSLGEAYSNGPLEITISSVQVGCRSDMPDKRASEGRSLVSLEATVQNLEHEDVPVHGYLKSDVFGLEVPDSKDALKGVYVTGRTDAIEDVVAGATMDLMVVWEVPDEVLAKLSVLAVRVYDLQKTQRTLIPSVIWDTTNRDTGGRLSTPKVTC